MKMDCIPKDIVNKILEYYGKIRYKNGKYTNMIIQDDYRYKLIEPLIDKKIQILKNAEVYKDENNEHQFYFEFGFDNCNQVGLCYDYNFTYKDKFEICYYDTRDGWDQIRTYI
jgi:hypothetical protein